MEPRQRMGSSGGGDDDHVIINSSTNYDDDMANLSHCCRYSFVITFNHESDNVSCII
jgi:hypothetical protein